MFFCKDCMWLDKTGIKKACVSPNNITYDPVCGTPRGRFTLQELRAMPKECGPDATWFISKGDGK